MKFRGASALLAVCGVAIIAALVFFADNFQARRESVQRAEVHLKRGIHLYQQKAYAGAELELRRALRANRDDWKAPFYVGAVQIERRRFDMAIPYLERALTLNPTEPKILNALGVVYFKLGRLDMAKGYFWASLELDPANSAAKGLMESMAKLQWRAAQVAESEKG
jgi:Flp pilus assembly protein TadD